LLGKGAWESYYSAIIKRWSTMGNVVKRVVATLFCVSFFTIVQAQSFDPAHVEQEESSVFGFIDRNGRTAIDLRKDHDVHRASCCSQFSEGLSACSNYYTDMTSWLMNKEREAIRLDASFIRTDGTFFPKREAFLDCANFSEGRAAVATAEVVPPKTEPTIEFILRPPKYYWNFIDKAGIVQSGQFAAITDYSQSLAGVLPVDSKYWQFIDKGGVVKITGLFSSVRPFAQNRASVCVNSKWGLIDSSGKEILASTYDNRIRSFHEGLAAVEIPRANRVDYLDLSGKVQFSLDRKYPLQKKFLTYDPEHSSELEIVKPNRASYSETFEPGLDIADGLVIIEKNGKFGYSDLTGKEVIAPIYDYCWPFAEGRGRVYQEGAHQGYFGYVDRSGKEIIPCKYVEGKNFSEGFAVVMEKDSFQNQVEYIDYAGTNTFKKKFPAAESFHEGFAFVGLLRTP